jgi:hypothetical protein
MMLSPRPQQQIFKLTRMRHGGMRDAFCETGINKKATVNTLHHPGVYLALFAGQRTIPEFTPCFLRGHPSA